MNQENREVLVVIPIQTRNTHFPKNLLNIIVIIYALHL